MYVCISSSATLLVELLHTYVCNKNTFLRDVLLVTHKCTCGCTYKMYHHVCIVSICMQMYQLAQNHTPNVKALPPQFTGESDISSVEIKMKDSVTEGKIFSALGRGHAPICLWLVAADIRLGSTASFVWRQLCCMSTYLPGPTYIQVVGTIRQVLYLVCTKYRLPNVPYVKEPCLERRCHLK